MSSRIRKCIFHLPNNMKYTLTFIYVYIYIQINISMTVIKNLGLYLFCWRWHLASGNTFKTKRYLSKYVLGYLPKVTEGE